MKVIATTEEMLNVVREILTTGLPYFANYGFIMDYNGGEYSKARKVLDGLDRKEDDVICIEDVQMQMLSMGYSLRFIDTENDDTATLLTLELIKKNWDKIPMKDLAHFAPDGDYDANDADNVMQYILFGELVYG